MQLLPESANFFVNTEMLARARLRLPLTEVGVRHRPRRQGQSKVSLAEVPKTLSVLLPSWWAHAVTRRPASLAAAAGTLMPPGDVNSLGPATRWHPASVLRRRLPSQLDSIPARRSRGERWRMGSPDATRPMNTRRSALDQALRVLLSVAEGITGAPNGIRTCPPWCARSPSDRRAGRFRLIHVLRPHPGCARAAARHGVGQALQCRGVIGPAFPQVANSTKRSRRPPPSATGDRASGRAAILDKRDVDRGERGTRLNHASHQS